MKKLLFAALLSLAGVGLSTGQASAWLLHCHKCCKGSATVCVKPYNAFSPSVFGSITADGCFPLSFANHGPAGPPPWFGGPPPWFGGAGPGCAMDGAGAAHGTAATMSPPARGTPTMLPGGGGVPTFQAPSPSKVPAGAPAGAQVGMPGVQAAGYAPPPWMQPPTAPGYWGNPTGR
jgi:hypothetical protein